MSDENKKVLANLLEDAVTYAGQSFGLWYYYITQPLHTVAGKIGLIARAIQAISSAAKSTSTPSNSSTRTTTSAASIALNTQEAITNLILLAVGTLATSGFKRLAKHLFQSLIFLGTNNKDMRPRDSYSLPEFDMHINAILSCVPLLFQRFSNQIKVILLLHYLHFLAFERPAVSVAQLMQTPKPITIDWSQLAKEAVSETQKTQVCMLVGVGSSCLL
jgi:hypothetical protein